jgi:SNF2 family DNA or RNA helicase
VAGFDVRSGTVAIEGVSQAHAPVQPGHSSARGVVGIRGDAAAAGERVELPLGQRLAYLLQPPLDAFLVRQGALEWPHGFFPFQREGVAALIERDVLLLADDMGLGKTVQAVAALRILAHRRRIAAALVVVPASVVTQWQRTFREWAPELRVSTVRGTPEERAWRWKAPAHVYLTTYETLRADATSQQAPPRQRVWDVVVLDEAQRIKNRDAEVSRACKRVPRRRAWALTGTPLENNVEELASVCEFLVPWEEGQALRALRPGPELRELHRGLQLRRKKREVLTELPPKTVTEVVLPLTPEQRASYERAREEGVLWLREMGRDVRITHVLHLIMVLKQICNFCPATGRSAKLDDVERRVEALVDEGHRALIFSQFVHRPFGVREIVQRLERFRPLEFTGDQAAPERDRIVAAFRSRSEHKVLVLSLRAGGHGLNLQDASYVFHFDRWWNPAVERQAEDRAHRLGQTVPVTVYKYVSEATIEEQIDRLLREKQALFDELVDDVSIDLGEYLSAEELFGLFGLSPPRLPGGRHRMERDFRSMSGEEFEAHVAGVLRRYGWSVEVTGRTRDGGVDLIARRIDEVGVESVLYVQCKNHVAPVGVEVVRELNGILDPGVRGVVVCPSGFTREAKAFAEQRGIQLWDGPHLRKLEAGP